MFGKIGNGNVISKSHRPKAKAPPKLPYISDRLYRLVLFGVRLLAITVLWWCVKCRTIVNSILIFIIANLFYKWLKANIND